MEQQTHTPSIGLKEVAEACHVSLMTVSRALRQNSVIRPETRALVLQKADELGYLRSSRKGRPVTPKSCSTDQIQLIFGTSSGNMYYFHMRLLTALEQQLAEAGFECVIRTSSSNFAIFTRLLDRVRQDNSKATIILGSFLPQQLEQLLLAVPGALLLDNHVRPAFQGSYSSFSFDNRKAAYLGVSHLAQAGRHKILLLAGPQEHFFTSEITAGYMDALKDNHLEYVPERIIHTNFTAEGATQELRKVLDKGIAFDAVFTNDEMATGVYRLLQEKQISIPAQVAVCGCDNLPIGAQLYPQLTTIALDYNELAACAVQHILSGKSATVFPDIKLPPVLCINQSSLQQ